MLEDGKRHRRAGHGAGGAIQARKGILIGKVGSNAQERIGTGRPPSEWRKVFDGPVYLELFRQGGGPNWRAVLAAAELAVTAAIEPGVPAGWGLSQPASA